MYISGSFEISYNVRVVVCPTNISFIISLPNPGRAAPRVYLKLVDLSRAKGDWNGCQRTRYWVVGSWHLSVESSRNCMG